MNITENHKISLTEEKETLLITLQAKALDSRLKNSILHDKKAEEILQMIDYNFEKINSFGNEIMVIRAKQLDTWLQEYIRKNPNATILNLGCGLDTRISRIDPPPTTRWFDIDFPEVIELRKSFFSNSESYEMVPSSVNELGWLEKAPKSEPVMIMIEGMLEYLTEGEVKILLNRLTSYFPNGQIAFDVMNSFAINSGKEKLKETTGAIHKWPVNNIDDIEKLDSRLKRTVCISVFKSKFAHKLPLKTRILFTSMGMIPSFKNMMRLLLYKF